MQTDIKLFNNSANNPQQSNHCSLSRPISPSFCRGVHEGRLCLCVVSGEWCRECCDLVGIFDDVLGCYVFVCRRLSSSVTDERRHLAAFIVILIKHCCDPYLNVFHKYSLGATLRRQVGYTLFLVLWLHIYYNIGSSIIILR